MCEIERIDKECQKIIEYMLHRQEGAIKAISDVAKVVTSLIDRIDALEATVAEIKDAV